MRQIEQGKGPESDTNTLPIALMKSKMATNNPKFYKGAIKLYKNVLPPGRYAISCKVMNDPRSRNSRAPNEATYLNVIVMCQPFLSQKEILAWKLYHNKNPNSMMPMLTFEWNILAFRGLRLRRQCQDGLQEGHHVSRVKIRLNTRKNTLYRRAFRRVTTTTKPKMRTNKRVGVTHTNLTGSESTVENWGVIETVNGCVHARFRGFLSTLLCAKEHLCVYGSRRKLRILTAKDTCMSGKHEQNERSKHAHTHIHIHKRYHPETERDTCKPKQNIWSPFLGGMLDANVHLQCLLALEAPLSIPLPQKWQGWAPAVAQRTNLKFPCAPHPSEHTLCFAPSFARALWQPRLVQGSPSLDTPWHRCTPVLVDMLLGGGPGTILQGCKMWACSSLARR
mmetsp:Transcript_98883/g.159408  ORF Transcript_98883/g.159408 Transcript_98883/m.159408 type:complete len:393 (+) Transcript_98883:579-1757(+)